MQRLTGRNKEYECRIEYCDAENWTKKDYPCDDCPFMKYINKLAEYEDRIEELEDDCK